MSTMGLWQIQSVLVADEGDHIWSPLRAVSRPRAGGAAGIADPSGLRLGTTWTWRR